MHSTNWNISNRQLSIGAALVALLITALGATPRATADANTPSRHPYIPHTAKSKWYQFGKASWYGHQFQGKKTASGEAFDFHMLTCAHRTLPIGTLVRVTNLSNRRSIMVRVNDRGPVPSGLIVDLSFAAARSLGFNRRGNANVKLERVDGAEAAQLNWPNLGRPENAPISR